MNEIKSFKRNREIDKLAFSNIYLLFLNQWVAKSLFYENPIKMFLYRNYRGETKIPILTLESTCFNKYPMHSTFMELIPPVIPLKTVSLQYSHIDGWMQKGVYLFLYTDT